MKQPPKIQATIFSTIATASLFWTGCTADVPSGKDLTTDTVLQTLAVPSGPGAMAPNLTATQNRVHLSWLEPASDGSGHALYVSSLTGDQWSPVQQISSGEGFFANWADLPAVTEAADGTRFAHWLSQLGDDTYAYGVALARSRPGTGTWEELGWLHDDRSPTEHGFVSYVPLPDGDVQAFWLDGRAMPAGGGMQLLTTRLTAEGPDTSQLLDDRVCECCATDAALGSGGPLIVYRDRSDSEMRDIAVVRSTPDGWSKPTLINDDGWQIHGCPVNGPAIAAAGDRVAVAWFTAGGGQAKVLTAFSEDAGSTFGEPIVIDDAQPLGRVSVALDSSGDALVSWMGSSGDGAEVLWRRVSPNGESGPAQVAVSTTAKRSAGVPRMVRHGERLLLAWVEDTDPSHVKTGVVALR